MCFSTCGFAHVNAGTQESRKETDPLVLELWTAINYLIGVLGIQYRSYAIAVLVETSL